MKIRFYDRDHEAFFRRGLERASTERHRQDTYFRSLLYLCGLCPETREHFSRLFEWQEWSICPESLEEGWQTGTSRKTTRLAFNLWNGYGLEQPDDERISPAFLPDELFCCEFQSFFFEAIRLRFPEYTDAGPSPSHMELG